jgi:uncharacterized membrane protein
MAFCGQCGAEGTGRFCAKCGAILAEPTYPAPASLQAAPRASVSFPGENIIAGLSYFVPVPLQLLLLIIPPMSRSKTVRFHALQSLFVWILGFILDYMFTSMNPLWETGPSAARFLHVVWGILLIALMIATFFKRRFALPVVGQMAERIVWAGGHP